MVFVCGLPHIVLFYYIMKPTTIALILALIFAVGASFAIGYISARHKYDKPVDGKDTVTIETWVHDTITKYVSKPGKTIYVYLPAVHDTTEVHDTTTIRDSVLVEVPIEERTYTGDNYRAVVSGFQPELKDIWVRQTMKYVYIPYQKRWVFTVGPQVGYGFTPKGWQPYAGAGITFGYSF